jgi:hypothetical protein
MSRRFKIAYSAGRVDAASLALPPRALALAAAAFVQCVAVPAHGQGPGLGVRAMPSIVRAGIPVPADDTLVLTGNVGYGYLDAVEEQSAGSRGLGGLALAYSPLPQLTIGADVVGRRDNFDDGVNLYGEPRLSLRFASRLSRTQFLGVMLDARFVGAEAPSVEWRATSPSLRGLYGARLGSGTWLGVELGFELDRSEQAVPDLRRVSATDERTLGASSWSAVPIGIGVAREVGDTWQLLGEAGGDWLVGQNSPGVAQFPWRVGAGVRHQLSRSWTAQLGVEVSLSSREAVAASRTLSREPRVLGFAALGWALEREVPKPPVAVAKVVTQKSAPIVVEPKEEAPKAPPSSSVVGMLVDEGGRPMADGEVILVREGVEMARVRTAADGQFSFEGVVLGAVVLRVQESGYDALEFTLGPGEPRTAELVLRPAVPAGQVRGKVLDLQGMPILAQVRVSPGDLNLTVALDGSFELDLAPGRYTLRFDHPEFAPQRRTIVVKDRGVVIINIGLVR